MRSPTQARRNQRRGDQDIGRAMRKHYSPRRRSGSFWKACAARQHCRVRRSRKCCKEITIRPAEARQGFIIYAAPRMICFTSCAQADPEGTAQER